MHTTGMQEGKSVSEALIRQLGEVLGGGVFKGLIQGGAGFHARRGIGTYESFLREAGLRPPHYFAPERFTPERQAFQEACQVKARTIVRHVEQSDGLEISKAQAITGPCTLYRVVSQTEDGASTGEWGSWWFSEEVMREVAEQSRRRGAQILGDLEYKAQRRENLRRALAVRVDWNAMVFLCSMKVMGGSFPAILGTGRSQPVSTPSPTQRSVPATLRGGYEQVWLPWTPVVPLTRESL